MSSDSQAPAESTEVSHPPTRRWVKWMHGAENWILAVCLLGIMCVPLLAAVLRQVQKGAFAEGSTIAQHLVLIVGMLGAAVAAREDRLLSLSSATGFLKGIWARLAKWFAYGTGAAMAGILVWAALDYARGSRDLAQPFAFGIPLWIIQLCMPIGFGLIAFRLLWHGGSNWKWRVAVLVLAGAWVLAGWKPPIDSYRLVWPALTLLLIATALGAPMFVALGGAGLILFWGEELPVVSLPIDHYQMAVNPALATVPLFTMAGYFLAEGGASARLIRVFKELVGPVRGGAAILTALVCAFFTSFTGASGVTILALGGLLMPVLLSAGHTEKFSLGLLTGSGALGLLLPPCIPLVLYAIIAGRFSPDLTIEAMFLGGVLPGLVLVLLTSAWGIWNSPSRTEGTVQGWNGGELRAAVWDAKWELLLPVVALVSLFGGFATTVEAAAITALYALVIEVVVYRGLHPIRDLPRVLAECGLLVGGVLLILGVAMGFNNFLVDEMISERALEWVGTTFESRWAFLLALNGFLLVVGMLMDIFAALIVVAPLIAPMGEAFDVHPVHLGIIFLANLQLGYLTPPIGMNLFLASYRFNLPLTKVYRAALPMFVVLLLGVALITYVPVLTTWLPDQFKPAPIALAP